MELQELQSFFLERRRPASASPQKIPAIARCSRVEKIEQYVSLFVVNNDMR